MEDKIIELISNHFGLSFLVGVIAVGVLIFLIWWARGVYEKVKGIDKLPCQGNSDKIDNLINRQREVEVSNTRIETSISYLQKNIESLSQSLQSNNKGLIIDPFTQTHSPLAITPAGLEMMDRLGIKEMFQQNWERINQLITDHVEQKNPYDIQQFCLEQSVVFPEKFLGEADLNAIKLDAYERGVPLASYMKVVAVLSRDRYFKEHGIDVSEVDKNDPAFRQD